VFPINAALPGYEGLVQIPDKWHYCQQAPNTCTERCCNQQSR